MKPKMKQVGKASKAKGKIKWKKGHSSESNPDTRKHRLAAKNRFFNQTRGPSNLTVGALAKHDAVDDGDAVLSEGDVQSQGGRTFNTWATNWTDCTNTTFSRVHRYLHSNSALHKEILAVLAAVTEVIKMQDGKETETEYFAALMTTLQTVDSPMSLTAVSYLLSLAMKSVPVSVLKLRFSEISKTLLDQLAQQVNSEQQSLLRSLVTCLATTLKAQEQVVWSQASTMQVYNGLLSFICHPKPKVRRAAQQAVRLVLRGSVFMTRPDPPPHHPAAPATAKYCIRKIEECGGGTEATSSLHTLELLKEILGVFPHNSLKSSCEAILRIMTLSNVVVTSVSMRTLHAMFLMNPNPSSLPTELNAQIITALYDYQPGENDIQPMAAWLAVMEAAHVNLAKMDGKLCMSHLPRLVVAAMRCMQTDRQEVAKAAAKTIKGLLTECIQPEADWIKESIKSTSKTTPVHKMFAAVEKGLGYQYHASWGLVLQVLQVFFEVLGKQCPSIMMKCLLSMADLRDSHGFPHTVALDKAVGTAICQMGPRQVLSAIPLQITGENDNLDFPRSWLIPVIRDNTQETELGFFTEYFLPLAAKLRVKALEYQSSSDIVKAKTYDALQLQIWSLLPGFCIRPTDLVTSFKGIARILGSAITDREDLRSDVMAALRKLINQNLENAENRAELAKFAKNFLPLFFNLFTSNPAKEGDKARQAILETIKIYMQISDSELLGSFFDKAYSKLSEEDLSNFRRHALMDLMIVMVPYIEEAHLKNLFHLVEKHVESTDHTVQKKSYRILEELCSGKSNSSKGFVTTNLSLLQVLLLKTLSSSGASSKAPRLRCLVHIFMNLDHKEMTFLRTVVPEAILCTKAIGDAARKAAYSLLVEMGNAVQRWSEKPANEAVIDYMELLMAGLAGSPQMISSTVNALTRVMYEYKELVTSELLEVTIDNTCILLTSKAREIVVAALGLLKVILGIFPSTVLAQFLEKMISSLITMKDDNRHHFRFKAKDIFAKLIRKFGYETILKMLPESHYKILKNIKKCQEQAKKKRKEKKYSDDEEDDLEIKTKQESIDELLRDTDSELEDNEGDKPKWKQQRVRTRTTGGAWLKEGQDEDVIDFLDPSVSKKVLATQPSKSKKKGIEHNFKTAPDGRLVISENVDNDENKQKGKRKAKDEDMDDLNDLLDALQGPGKKSRKRKMSDSLDVADEDMEPMRYQAGGTGIHRPMTTAKKQKTWKDTGSEYKAKKAGGDIKKKGAPDPYAYVPLEHQLLNRRKKKKVQGQFKNLVKGAKKGASRGQRQKGRQRMSKK